MLTQKLPHISARYGYGLMHHREHLRHRRLLARPQTQCRQHREHPKGKPSRPTQGRKATLWQAYMHVERGWLASIERILGRCKRPPKDNPHWIPLLSCSKRFNPPSITTDTVLHSSCFVIIIFTTALHGSCFVIIILVTVFRITSSPSPTPPLPYRSNRNHVFGKNIQAEHGNRDSCRRIWNLRQ